MKRALLVLLLLAVAGGLFAQTLTWSGHVQSGIEAVIPNEGDATLAWYNWDNGASYRFQIGASYTSADGKAGAQGIIRNNGGSFAVDQGRAWVYPLDILRLQIGNGGPGGFGTLGSFDDGRNAGDAGGLSAILTPALDGATFSLAATLQPTSVTFDNSTYNFGVAFGLPSLLNARANLKYIGSGNDGDGQINAGAGIGVLALNAASGETGLTRLAIDVRADNLTKDLAWIGIGPAIGFRVAGVGSGALSTTLQARVFVPLNDDNDLDYAVGLDLSVPFGTTTFGLDVGYEGAVAGLPAINDSKGLNARGWDPLPKSIGGTDAALNIRPYLSFNIGGATLQGGWAIQTLLADEVQMQHGIYLNLNVGF
jgi:hypothetical protein